jgi:predicted RNase H-like HicB family nuclease
VNSADTTDSNDVAAGHYSVVIEWSDQDNAYVVTLPEWADRYVMPVGDGTTYEEALASAQNALATFIELARQDGTPLPAPRTFAMD